MSEAWVDQWGYKIDGIEGYVFPKTVLGSPIAQPPGTVKLCRKYYSGHDDYVLFPGAGVSGTDCSTSTDGYTPGGNNYTEDVVNDNWIGWVYPARAPQSVGYSTGFLAAINLFSLE